MATVGHTPPFVVGSQDRIVGTVYDRQGTTRTAVDLSTVSSIILKASINGGTSASWTCTADGDQVNNTGRFTYDLGATDIASAGRLELQAHVTLGAKVYKSKTLSFTVIASL